MSHVSSHRGKVHDNSQPLLTRALMDLVRGSNLVTQLPLEGLFSEAITLGLDFSMCIWGETPQNSIQSTMGMCLCIFWGGSPASLLDFLRGVWSLRREEPGHQRSVSRAGGLLWGWELARRCFSVPQGTYPLLAMSWCRSA